MAELFGPIADGNVAAVTLSMLPKEVETEASSCCWLTGYNGLIKFMVKITRPARTTLRASSVVWASLERLVDPYETVAGAENADSTVSNAKSILPTAPQELCASQILTMTVHSMCAKGNL